MTWRGANEMGTGAQAYQYLIEAWGERSADFQPGMVARWVERLAARGGPALTASIIEYDTYALPALMAALPHEATPAATERARHLLNVARHATGLPWAIPQEAAPDVARQVVQHWKRWWNLHAAEYVVARGPSRLSAALQQTRFWQWTTLAVKFQFGTTKNDQSISDHLATTGLPSLLLLLSATAGVAGTTFVRTRWQRRRPPGIRSWGTTILESIPHCTVIAIMGRASLGHGMVAACATAAMVLSLACLAARNDTPLQRPTPTHPRELAIPDWQFIGHGWPVLLTVIFMVEKAFGISGIGQTCVAAFRSRDLHMLMAVTTVTALWLLVVEFVVQSKRRPIPQPKGRRI
jgi:hypothetical protein